MSPVLNPAREHRFSVLVVKDGVECFLAVFKIIGQNIRKLVKDGFIIKKPQVIHSRARARRRKEAISKGRHTGYGRFTAK